MSYRRGGPALPGIDGRRMPLGGRHHDDPLQPAHQRPRGMNYPATSPGTPRPDGKANAAMRAASCRLHGARASEVVAA
jgi:hypothetical protein